MELGLELRQGAEDKAWPRVWFCDMCEAEVWLRIG